MNLIYNILQKVENLDEILQSLDSLVKSKRISYGEATNEVRNTITL